VGQNRQNISKSVDELTAQEWAAWTDMRAQNPDLISPYFHPDYVRRLGALQSDLRVICAYDGDEILGFLALQGRRFSRPAGMPLSDFQGLIKAPDTQLSYGDILQNIVTPMGKHDKRGAYHFSALVDIDNVPDTNIMEYIATAAINIETGADDWRAAQESSYNRHLKSTRRRIRKAEEDIGPRRFVFKSQNADIFDRLMAWKFKKFEDTGKYNVLSVDWTMAFIRGLWEHPTENGLRCDMHAIYFGDRLAAVDLGLSDGPIFHSWMVAYESDFQHYAPGIQLLEGLIDEAVNLGYRRIDMGAGTEGYKRHYATHGHEVISGFIPVQGFSRHIAQLYNQAERWGHEATKDAAGKLRRRYSQIAACETRRINRAKAMLAAIQSASKK